MNEMDPMDKIIRKGQVKMKYLVGENQIKLPVTTQMEWCSWKLACVMERFLISLWTLCSGRKVGGLRPNTNQTSWNAISRHRRLQLSLLVMEMQQLDALLRT